MGTNVQPRDPIAAALAPDLEHFEAILPIAEYARLRTMLQTQDRLLADEYLAEAERVERVVKEHLPGLRPMLDLLWAHFNGCYLDCCEDAGGPRQRYRQAAPAPPPLAAPGTSD